MTTSPADPAPTTASDEGTRSSRSRSGEKIRVGIIGAGGWAKYGHIPALRSVDAFEVTAVASRTQASADRLAADLGIHHALADYQQLVEHPEVDLVVITAPGPEHARLTRLVIAAGKDVYCEWPLSTTTEESAELLELAQGARVRHVVGLQRRFAPSIRYVRDLLSDGYVGTVRGVSMSVGVDAFGPVLPERAAWTVDPANFTDLLSIYGGHFGDVLFHLVGSPEQVAALSRNQFPTTTIAETGQQLPYRAAHEVMVIGALAGGGLFSVQLEGAQSLRTGLQLDITGTEGALRVTNPRGFENAHDNTVHGMRGEVEELEPLPVPAAYEYLDQGDLDASVHDVAYLYDAYARDRREGSSEVTDFADAVRQHRFIDEITASSARFDDGGGGGGDPAR